MAWYDADPARQTVRRRVQSPDGRDDRGAGAGAAVPVIGAGALNLLSLVYGVLAVRMAWDVWRGRQSLFDDQVTPEDQRRAQGIAFYLLWPPAVLLHEGGHALVAALFGAHHIRLHFFGYWGEITYDPTLSDRQDWWVALAGNAVTYGWDLSWRWSRVTARRRLIWRIILFSVASNQWFVVLLWYPGLCLTGTFWATSTRSMAGTTGGPAAWSWRP